MKTKNLKNIALIVSGLLLVPLVAMQFSNEVNWTLFDFVIAGTILLSAGFAIELIRNKVKNPNTRSIVLAIIILAIIILWTELAVGIFGSPLAGS